MNDITIPQSLSASGIRRVVRERKRTILGVAAVFAVAGALVAWITPPTYRATSRVEFRTSEERDPWSGQPARTSNYQSENAALYTSAEQITSRRLLSQVAAALERPDALVASENAADHRMITTTHRGLFDVAAARATEVPELSEVSPASVDPVRLENRIRDLKRSVRVQPVKDTRLVDISVEDSDPEIARAVAGRLARLFVASERERSFEADTTGLGFMLVQIDDVRRRIALTSDALQRHGASSEAFAQARAEQLRSKISGLGSAYTDARNARLESQARLDLVKRRSGTPSSRIYDSDGLRAARAEAEQVRTKLAQAKEVYGPRHPKVQALAGELEATQARLKDEAGRAAADLSAERSMHSMREGALGSELARATDELAAVQMSTKRQSVEESELAVDQELYARLLSRARQMGFEKQLATASVAVAEPASVDPTPVRPRRALTFVVALVTGLLVGLGFALLGDSAGRTIRNSGDAESQLDLPVLGQISRQF
jgi:uncharacterized protein involved in exopolysaccharide biosynthesis